jgi:hypothetical protein
MRYKAIVSFRVWLPRWESLLESGPNPQQAYIMIHNALRQIPLCGVTSKAGPVTRTKNVRLGERTYDRQGRDW